MYRYILILLSYSLIISTSRVNDTRVTHCVTIGGNHPGVSCKFPFYYDLWNDFKYLPTSILRLLSNTRQRKIWFNGCTSYRNHGKKWCATEVSSSNMYVTGSWGLCPQSLECNSFKESWIKNLGRVKIDAYLRHGRNV